LLETFHGKGGRRFESVRGLRFLACLRTVSVAGARRWLAELVEQVNRVPRPSRAVNEVSDE